MSSERIFCVFGSFAPPSPRLGEKLPCSSIVGRLIPVMIFPFESMRGFAGDMSANISLSFEIAFETHIRSNSFCDAATRSF